MKKLNELLEEFQSTVLGTQGENSYPFSSYAQKMNELVERTGKRGHK